MRHVQASLLRPKPLFGTEHLGAQEPKRIHVIVEYMSSPYLRSAVGVALDCFHMPGRGQGSRWWRRRAGLSFLPARFVCEREGVGVCLEYTIQADLNQPRTVNIP